MTSGNSAPSVASDLEATVQVAAWGARAIGMASVLDLVPLENRKIAQERGTYRTLACEDARCLL